MHGKSSKITDTMVHAYCPQQKIPLNSMRQLKFFSISSGKLTDFLAAKEKKNDLIESVPGVDKSTFVRDFIGGWRGERLLSSLS